MNTERKTILVISIGFGIIAYFTQNWILGAAVALVLMAGFASRKMAHWIHFIWMKLAHYMGKITQPIILGVVYFFILWPVSLLSKLSRKDPLMLRNRMNTTFRPVQKTFPKEEFEKIW